MSKVQRFRPAGASAPEVVLASDYDRLEAENKALLADKYKDAALIHKLRTEISDLRSRAVVVPERMALVGDNAFHAGHEDYRAGEVIEVSSNDNFMRGWNACLDELARINGRTVSVGLLQRIEKYLAPHVCKAPSGKIATELHAELRALLDTWNGHRE